MSTTQFTLALFSVRIITDEHLHSEKNEKLKRF